MKTMIAKRSDAFYWRRLIHPIMWLLIKANRKMLCHHRIRVIGNKWDGEEPVIFAVSHIGRYDYQIISEVLKVHQIPFAGDQDKMYGTFDGFMLWLNGVLYCDTDKKEDRKNALLSSIEIVNNGHNLLIYPEGIWNISANIPILPLFPGVIRISMETGRSIVPIAIEQYGRNFVVNIGERFRVINSGMNTNDKNIYIDQKRRELREIMITLKWEIYESIRTVKRSRFGDFERYNKHFRAQRLEEWCDKKGFPFYDDVIIHNRTYK